MKRNLLILMLMAVCAIGNVMAAGTVTKTFSLLPLSADNKIYNNDNITIIDNNGFKYNAGTTTETTTDKTTNQATTKTVDAWGNAAVGWNYESSKQNYSEYTNLVLELSEPTTSTVEIVIGNGSFWGMDRNFSYYLPEGRTKAILSLDKMLVNNTPVIDGTADSTDASGNKVTDSSGNTLKKKIANPYYGKQIDLTAISIIFIRTGWVHEQTIMIKDFYFEKVSQETTANDYEEVDLSTGFAYRGTPTINGTQFTSTSNTDWWGVDVSKINTSLYKYLVICPKRPYTEDMGKQYLYGLNDGINDYSDWGLSYGFWQPRHANVINLDAKTVYYDKNENSSENNVAKDFSSSPIECDSLKILYIRPESADCSYDISAIYFTNTCPTFDNRNNGAQADYIRETTDSLAWGTVCLPYASAICGAKAYTVAGINDVDKPTTLYLKEAIGVLQAGVPYIYQTTSVH